MQKSPSARGHVLASLSVFASCLAVAAAGSPGQELPSKSEVRLVTQARAVARIVLPSDTSEPVRFAAEELQKYIRRMTGATLPIEEGGQAVNGEEAAIVLHSGEADVKDALAGLPEDAYLIRASGKRIHLTGVTPRATLYAVYDLLERLGCGFPRPGHSYLRQATEAPGSEEETIPKLSTVAVPVLDIVKKPAFGYRALLCFPLMKDRSIREIDWMVKNRFNWVHLITNTDLSVWEREQVRAAILPEIRKRGLNVQGIGHSFFAYIPPDKYYKDHPEYFAMMDGERKPAHVRGATLCTSNPEVVRVMIDNMSLFLQANPEIKIIDLWNNDGLGWCECPKCREMNGLPADAKDRYRSTTRGYLRFVNAVARGLDGRHRGIRVNALAYGLNLHSDPQTPPESNVVLGVAPWDRVAYAGSDDYYVPVSEPGRVNDYLRVALMGWVKQTKEIYIYDYYANRNEFFPIVDTLRKDYAWYLKHGIAMLSSETIFWDEFNLWAYGRLTWDPGRTVRDLAKEFCAVAYRAAAEPMVGFHVGLERHKWEWPLHRNELGELLDEADAKAKAADDPTVVVKIRRLKEVLASDPQKSWPHDHPPPELAN